MPRSCRWKRWRHHWLAAWPPRQFWIEHRRRIDDWSDRRRDSSDAEVERLSYTLNRAGAHDLISKRAYANGTTERRRLGRFYVATQTSKQWLRFYTASVDCGPSRQAEIDQKRSVVTGKKRPSEVVRFAPRSTGCHTSSGQWALYQCSYDTREKIMAVGQIIGRGNAQDLIDQ